jgi:hypothetical protein
MRMASPGTASPRAALKSGPSTRRDPRIAVALRFEDYHGQLELREVLPVGYASVGGLTKASDSFPAASKRSLFFLPAQPRSGTRSRPRALRDHAPFRCRSTFSSSRTRKVGGLEGHFLASRPSGSLATTLAVWSPRERSVAGAYLSRSVSRL